jgi:hypothetical protein
MEAGTQEQLPGTQRRSTGRKDRDGTEESPDFTSIKKGCAEMMLAYKKLESAREAFNDCVKAVSERGNCNAATLKRLVRASASGNFTDHRRMIEQQSIVFEMVGEIPGGASEK